MTKKSMTEWFRPRGYRHFDAPWSEGQALTYVRNKLKIQKHAFFPFIKFTMETPRFDKTSKTVGQKDREIYYSSHHDSAILSYYSWLLQKHYEIFLKHKPFRESVLAYRKLGKSNIDFAHEAFKEIADRGDCYAMCFDVSKFFDTLCHRNIKNNLQIIINEPSLPDDWYAVYRAITRFSFVKLDELEKMFPSTTHTPGYPHPYCTFKQFRVDVRKSGLISTNTDNYGIPQGSPISATISNIYMIQFDSNVQFICSSLGASYRRYSDDIMVICDESDADYIKKSIVRELNSIGLESNEKKFEGISFKKTTHYQISNKPLQYLGLTYDGKRTLIRSSSIARFSRRMLNGVRHRKILAKKSIALKKTKRLYTRKLFERFSHLSSSERSFERYTIRAIEITKSKLIRRQFRKSWRRLMNEIEKK